MGCTEITARTSDGLRLVGDLYAAGGAKTPAICIPGLTRNAADFAELAPMIAATGRPALAVSLRGRARSDYDPDVANYQPLAYLADIDAFMGAIDAPRAVLIGTSLGGIVAMLMNARSPDRVAAAVINDVGPDLAPEGLARIGAYMANAPKEPAGNLDEAVARIKAINAVAFPDAGDDDWRRFAERTFRRTPDGAWTLDYDPNIARGLAENGPAPDLWPAWKSLADTPTLLARGALSDLLTPSIVEKMRAARPGFDYVEAARVGHAPFMTEADVWPAMEAFLARID